AEELNVASVDTLADAGDLVDVAAKPQFRALGRRFGPRTKDVAAAIGAADATALASALRGEGRAVLDVGGEQVDLSPDEVLLTETPRSDWAVTAAGGEMVALDLEISPELRKAGLAREVVRLVQDRKSVV